MEEKMCSNCKNFHQHYIKHFDGFSEFPKGHCAKKHKLVEREFVCENFEYFDFAKRDKENKDKRCRIAVDKIEELLEKVVAYIESNV